MTKFKQDPQAINSATSASQTSVSNTFALQLLIAVSSLFLHIAIFAGFFGILFLFIEILRHLGYDAWQFTNQLTAGFLPWLNILATGWIEEIQTKGFLVGLVDWYNSCFIGPCRLGSGIGIIIGCIIYTIRSKRKNILVQLIVDVIIGAIVAGRLVLVYSSDEFPVIVFGLAGAIIFPILAIIARNKLSKLCTEEIAGEADNQD